MTMIWMGLLAILLLLNSEVEPHDNLLSLGDHELDLLDTVS
jgi:hypothetical protein